MTPGPSKLVEHAADTDQVLRILTEDAAMKLIAFVTTSLAAALLFATAAVPCALAQPTSTGPGSSMPGRPNAPITGQQDTSATIPMRGPETTRQRTASDPTGQTTVTAPNAPTRRDVPGLSTNGHTAAPGSNTDGTHRP